MMEPPLPVITFWKKLYWSHFDAKSWLILQISPNTVAGVRCWCPPTSFFDSWSMTLTPTQLTLCLVLVSSSPDISLLSRISSYSNQYSDWANLCDRPASPPFHYCVGSRLSVPIMRNIKDLGQEINYSNYILYKLKVTLSTWLRLEKDGYHG